MRKLTDGLRPDDAREVVRIAGGLCLMLGLAVLAIRHEGGTEDVAWENLPLFLLWFAAGTVLYALGIWGKFISGVDRRWQAVFTVTGVLLIPIAFYHLANQIDSDYDVTWGTVVVFGFCACLCIAAWNLAAVRFQLLLGSLYSSIALVALLSKVFDDQIHSADFDAVRALLMLFAAGLVVVAFKIRDRGGPEPEAAFGELLTGAGLAALIAVAFGPLFFFGFFGLGLGYAVGGEGGFGPGGHLQGTVWDVLALVIGTGLVVSGTGRNLRGLVYVGGAMLFAFAVSTGLELDDPRSDGKFVGWPLLLILVGVAGLAYSLLAPHVPPALGRWYQGGREPLPAAAAPSTAVQSAPPPPPPPPS